MSPEDNKVIVRTFIEEGLNGYSVDTLDTLLAPTYTNYFPGAAVPLDRERFREVCEEFWMAFPDFEIQIHEMIAEGDAVAVRYTMRGTPLWTFQRITPSAQAVTVAGTSVYHLSDGYLVDTHPGFDAVDLRQQLGAVLPSVQASV